MICALLRSVRRQKYILILSNNVSLLAEYISVGRNQIRSNYIHTPATASPYNNLFKLMTGSKGLLRQLILRANPLICCSAAL